MDRNYNNENRLICYSVINGDNCIYGDNCTYAHSLKEQIIDKDKMDIYNSIFAEDLESDAINDDLYRNFSIMAQLCNQCVNNKCTGGLNCRNGACNLQLKLCKSDLLTGQCINPVFKITLDEFIAEKLGIDKDKHKDHYIGCSNGHHITTHQILPYYEYVQEKENKNNQTYSAVRYINIEPHLYVSRIDNNMDFESESSTDDEINEIFGSVHDNIL